MESIQAIKQEEDAAENIGVSEETGSEESRTLSQEQGLSEILDNPDPSKYSHRCDCGSTI